MSRVNPFSLKRGEGRVVSRTLTDPERSLEVPLTLRRLDGLELLKAVDRGNEYKALYLTGKDGKPPQVLLDPDDEPLAISESLCETVAMLELMEVPPEGEKPYNFHEWAIWAQRSLSIFTEAGTLLAEVQSSGTAAGNAPRAATGTP